MTNDDGNSSGWTVQFTGDADNPEKEIIVVTRHDPPQIRLEVHAPEIVSAGVVHNGLARETIQDAVNALQEALDSPSALFGVRQT